MLGELKSQIYPLSLTPILAEKPWGARRISIYHDPGSKAAWGEIFLAIKDFGLTSRVASGPLVGQGVHQVGRNWGAEFMDPPRPTGSPLPWTIWLERTGDKPGPVRVKTGPEFWYVLEAEPSSWIGAGLDPKQSQWPQRLARRVAEPSDAFIFPAGSPQAQGPGLTIIKAGLAKIDLATLYDWERQPDVWDYQPTPGLVIDLTTEPLTVLEPPDPTSELAVLGQLKGLEVKLLRSTFQSFKGGQFAIICPIKGQGRINSSGATPTLRLRPGGATIIPAGLGPHSIVSNSSLTALIFQGVA
ncbi:MAG: hypothetical protein LBS60_11105 [Deltaproteobacteria bacterium]|jgi:hypothetical protein|nr:hypothetical protein [Deltaproteobacteria bacterium]